MYKEFSSLYRLLYEKKKKNASQVRFATINKEIIFNNNKIYPTLF